MDYTKQSLLLKLAKTMRYTRMYGPRRTLSKVRGQYHMKRRIDPLLPILDATTHGGHVGFLGAGNFPFTTLAYYLRRNYGRVMRAAMDINIHRAASLCRANGMKYYTDDARRIIDDPEIDLVFIASNHASHAEYAIQCLQAGKSVHIEKPHVVSFEQLYRLCSAMTESKGRVMLGFNRPHSRLFQAVQHALLRAQGPVQLAWFVIGHQLGADHWYAREGEGGRVFGNLCHWTDLTYRLLPAANRYPITITPTSTTKPDCDIVVTFTFGDGSIATISFTAKGYSFEGVRETLSAQRGSVVVRLNDFACVTIDEGTKRRRIRPLFRDHGHEGNVTQSYALVCPRPGEAPAGCTIEYVWETAELFLETQRALATREQVVVWPFSTARLAAESTQRPA